MDLLTRFKQHYFHYLISIIIPTIITAASIPLFKWLLGSANYGRFAILFNSTLLCTATLTGWISQSILRFYVTSKNKHDFFAHTIRLTQITQAVFALPILLVVYYLEQDWLMAILFVIAMYATSLQFIIVAMSQSVFLSKKSIYSEFIRTVSYLSLSLILLRYTKLNYMYALFSAITISYVLSYFYLNLQVKRVISQTLNTEFESFKLIKQQFLKYGIALSLWFVVAYLLTLTDKMFMRHFVNAEMQGEYQAIFDLISKSITIIISPVIISMFPILTAAYEKGNRVEIKKLLTRIIFLEALGCIAALLGFWWFGANILFKIVQTPANLTFKWMGTLIILGTFFWQIAIVVQKKFELRYQSHRLLYMLLLAFLFQLGFYYFLKSNNSALIFPLGYCLTTLIYLLLISFSEIVNALKIIFGNKSKMQVNL